MHVELLDMRRWKTRVELANSIFEYTRSSTTAGGDTRAPAC